jgi:hypothetical protein
MMGRTKAMDGFVNENIIISLLLCNASNWFSPNLDGVKLTDQSMTCYFGHACKIARIILRAVKKKNPTTP